MALRAVTLIIQPTHLDDDLERKAIRVNRLTTLLAE
jgi:hypothetical protein